MNPYPTDDEDLLAELYELDCNRYAERKEVEKLQQLHDAGLISHQSMMTALNENYDPQETPVPKPTLVHPPEVIKMSADRVMRALAQDPTLLFDVACRMGATRLAILGPWSEQEEKERDPQGRITRVNWIRRFDAVGSAKSYICIQYRMDGKREVLDKIEWQVYIKQTDPDKPHIISHHAKGETYSVMQAQQAADEAAVERGWMLVD